MSGKRDFSMSMNRAHFKYSMSLAGMRGGAMRHRSTDLGKEVGERFSGRGGIVNLLQGGRGDSCRALPVPSLSL